MKLKLSSLFILLLLPFLIKAQWQRQYPLPKLSPVQAISVHHDGYGYAAGSDDLLMKLDPGTKTWSIVGDWAKNWRFTSVDYLEGDAGEFAAAGGPGLIMTENGGLNWTEIAGAPQGITAIRIFSSTDMIIIASSGVFRWKDKNWSNLNLPATSNVQGGDLLDDQHIWAFTNGASAAIYATADGGQNWTTSHDISSPDVVKFYNTDYGIATDSRMIFKSVNGGVNWTLISNNVIANTSADITFGASPNVLMSAALNANPAISQDSGKTWTNKPTGFISTRSFSVGATSDEDFWLGNDISSMAHTSDAGETWVESSGPPRNIIQDVHFINRTDGWAVGLKGYVLRTHDGGTVWEDVSKPDTKNYLCIDGLNENDLWIGSNQRILHSTDKGDNWTEKVVFLSGNINDILALSSTRILACSSTGVIYRTKDGGVKWDTVFSTSGQMRSLTRINNQQCMATGFNGVIMRSDDMGDTWHAVAIPLAGLQYEQSYFLGNEGWLVTSSFKHNMWHTTNGGDSWDTLTLPIDRFWDGIYFITPDTGIAVCHSNSEGRAYITFDGGAAWQTGYILPFQLSGVTGVHNPNGTAWIFGFGSDIEFLPYCNTLPGISDFMGDLFPCEKDTVTYSISSLNVDQFFWNLPPGWQFIGDPDNDTILVEVGRNSGFISVVGTNTCGFSGQITNSAGPDLLPTISEISGNEQPCQGADATYTVSAVNEDAVHWVFPSDWQLFGDTNSTSILVNPGFMPGTIQAYSSNQCGNSIVVEFDAFPFVAPMAVPQYNDTILTLNLSASSYQWYFNGQLIPGATESTYKPTASGNYYAILTFSNGCSGASLPIDVILSAVTAVPRAEPISIFPSPAASSIHLAYSGPEGYLLLSDQYGHLLLKSTFTGQPIDVSGLVPGVYFVSLRSMKGSFLGRFVKL